MDSGAEKLRDDIAAIEVAMLTTRDKTGNLHSCPLYTLSLDADGSLWFFARKDILKLGSEETNHQVSLSYADASTHTYISISGVASFVEDIVMKKKLWSPFYEAWFPAGMKDPRVTLLRVRMTTAEVWDTEEATMRSLLTIKKEKITEAAK